MINNEVFAIILGGGQGSRLHPLTEARSKPAVPIAGKYRLVDIPISNCINSDIKRMFVLTQFNSDSLNRHIKDTYHFSFFSSAFVDVLAAEQTPENKGWFQGTADAVRQSMHHVLRHEFDYVLILSGDQL
jgi:glucose-1-phosphate adenylyltransferase